MLLLTIFLIAANIISFLLVGLDKKQSRIQNAERFPEVYFFVWSIFFSSFGTLLAMFFFHHKTRKIYFPVGIALLLIEQIALLYLLNLFFKLS